MGLFSFIKKGLSVGLDPAGSAVRAASGKSVTPSGWRDMVDPANAVYPRAPGVAPTAPYTPYQPNAGGWTAPTMTREQMLAQALQAHNTSFPGNNPRVAPGLQPPGAGMQPPAPMQPPVGMQPPQPQQTPMMPMPNGGMAPRITPFPGTPPMAPAAPPAQPMQPQRPIGIGPQQYAAVLRR